jgi:hypothetical protein
VAAAKARSGVLPSAEWMFLAAHDRMLWLLLNGYGRRQPSAETLGVVAHHALEIAAGKPVARTMFREAAEDVLSTWGGVPEVATGKGSGRT